MRAIEHAGAADGELEMRILGVADSLWCGSRCADLAGAIGFEGRALAEIAVVVSELVTNALKFAGAGVVRARRVDAPRRGIEIAVEDRGPGIVDPAAATVDGFSEGRLLAPEDYAHRTRGLGAGLGAVARLTDELRIDSPPAGGVRVVVRKWLPAQAGPAR